MPAVVVVVAVGAVAEGVWREGFGVEESGSRQGAGQEDHHE